MTCPMTMGKFDGGCSRTKADERTEAVLLDIDANVCRWRNRMRADFANVLQVLFSALRKLSRVMLVTSWHLRRIIQLSICSKLL